MNMNKKCTHHFRNVWLKEPKYKSWLRRVENDDQKGFCKYCACFLVARISYIERHYKTYKHQKIEKTRLGLPLSVGVNERLSSTNREAPCEKYELTSEGNVGSDADQSMPNIHCEPLSSPMKGTITVPQTPSNSSGLENKTLDAICTFYKNINTPSRTSTADLEDSDEAFGRYLGKELKSFQNATVKRKLKQKILNMVYNTEDEPENAQMRPFPIFVSTQGGIPFVQSSKVPKTDL